MTSLSFPYCVNLNVQNAEQSCFLGIILKKKDAMGSKTLSARGPAIRDEIALTPCSTREFAANTRPCFSAVIDCIQRAFSLLPSRGKFKEEQN
jgi:hypothetical protein